MAQGLYVKRQCCCKLVSQLRDAPVRLILRLCLDFFEAMNIGGGKCSQQSTPSSSQNVVGIAVLSA